MATAPTIYNVLMTGSGGIGKGTLQTELYKLYCDPKDHAYHIKSSAGNQYAVRIEDAGHFYECYGSWTRYRPFHSTTVFLLCVAVDSTESVNELLNWYFCEAHTIQPTAPIIVIGLKSDLYQTVFVPTHPGHRLLPREELQQAADQIGAFAYIQLSCKTGQNLSQLLRVLADTMDAASNRPPIPPAPQSSGISKLFGKLLSSDPKPKPRSGINITPEKVAAPSIKPTKPTTPSGLSCTALEIFGGGSSPSAYFSYGHACTAYKNKLLFFGGSGLQKQLRASPFILDFSAEDPHWKPAPSIESGSPLTHSPEPTVTPPPSPATMPTECHTEAIPPGSQVAGVGSYSAMCAFAPLVFLFGGTYGGLSTNRLLSYDMDTCLWNCLFPHSVKSATDNFPDACYGASLLGFKNKLFLFGGCIQDHYSCQFFEFDLDSKTWGRIQEPNMPPPRYHHNAFADATGTMYIYGGLGEGNSKLSDLWAYNLNSLFTAKHTGWKQIPISGSIRPTPQRGHVGCMMPSSNSFLLCGSSNNNPHCELFCLDLGSFTWSQINFESDFVAREFHSVTPYRSSLLIAGGMWRRAEGGILGDAFTLVFPKYVSVVPLLPLDIWMHLLSLLQPADLCRLGHTCRDFYALCGSDELWRDHVVESIRTEKNLRQKFLGTFLVWRNPTPGVVKYTPPEWREPQPVVYECFLGNAFILMGDLSVRPVNSIRPGDFVMTEAYKPHRVQEVRQKKVDNKFRMVFLNGVGLTTGHPVFVNGQWVRSCDVSPPTLLGDWRANSGANDDTIYNFVLEGGPAVADHSVILNGLLVCTLGKDCGAKFRQEYPNADSRYGTGFWTTYAPQS
ncbi:hypothetical protein Pelo_1218 [Pelomyxa schiedti]|nr:hypothetical protein Pelo_1218 [Pelomyxa schiedti]